VVREATEVLGQRKLLQRAVPGVMHALIFWGFLVLLTTIVEALGQAVDPDFAIPWIGRTGWLGLVQDVFAGGVLVGLAIAVGIRLVQKPERFVGSHRLDAYRILGLIFWIIATLLLYNGARVAAGVAESPTSWTPLSTAASHLFTGMSPGGARVWMWIFVWLHLAIVLGFLVYLPHSKHLHIATSALNVWMASTRPHGALEPLRIDMAALEAGEQSLGAESLPGLTRKSLLDLGACTECGRCQSVCPAWNTGKPLSPKLLIMDLRDHALAEGPAILAAQAAGEAFEPQALVPEVVDDEAVWACTTCGACVEECPVDIEHIDTIVDLRRALVMGESRFPAEAGAMLRNLENSSNPWGQPQSERADWASGLGVPLVNGSAPEVLYWVGCAASFDERARTAAESTAKLLQAAGVDFAILGPRESCTGDPARRIGNEYLFQAHAETNVSTLNEAGVTKIVASCPHCFNTLGNEYPDFGGNYEVVHHTELLADLMRDGKLAPAAGNDQTITYHDSCYLARHNDVRADPRAIVEAVGTPIEMERREERTFCCGAGGAHMWMEERAGAINEERVREAAETGAETLAVACPFCTVMLDDGVRETGSQMRVADVATLLAESME
jgi:Fe-S oxidoreductase